MIARRERRPKLHDESSPDRRVAGQLPIYVGSARMVRPFEFEHLRTGLLDSAGRP